VRFDPKEVPGSGVVPIPPDYGESYIRPELERVPADGPMASSYSNMNVVDVVVDAGAAPLVAVTLAHTSR
jgi:hypothetical protein